jgi:hypothetical protein
MAPKRAVLCEVWRSSTRSALVGWNVVADVYEALRGFVPAGKARAGLASSRADSIAPVALWEVPTNIYSKIIKYLFIIIRFPAGPFTP